MAVVGYMGSGKSTVGRLVASLLGWELFDLDRAVEERAGLSIPCIFESSGEPYFRELEHDALLEALDGSQNRVVACGGGVVLDPRNRARLARVPTVFLHAAPDVLYRRTRGPGRPLRGASYEEFARRYAGRLPFYEEVASCRVATGNRPPYRAADEVVEWVKATAA